MASGTTPSFEECNVQHTSKQIAFPQALYQMAFLSLRVIRRQATEV